METDKAVQTQSKPWLFQPGQSGNPEGMRKGTRHFETLFREAVKKVAEGEAEADDVLIVRKVIAKAKEGDLKAADMVFDRTDGKIEATKDLGGNTTINVIQFTGDIVNGTIDPEDLS